MIPTSQSKVNSFPLTCSLLIKNYALEYNLRIQNWWILICNLTFFNSWWITTALIKFCWSNINNFT